MFNVKSDVEHQPAEMAIDLETVSASVYYKRISVLLTEGKKTIANMISRQTTGKTGRVSKYVHVVLPNPLLIPILRRTMQCTGTIQATLPD